MTRFRPVFSVLPLLGLLACASTSSAEAPPSASAGASTAGDFKYQKTIGAGAKVEVRDINGGIAFEPTGGDTLEVVATKTGRASDFGRVQIVSREENGTLVFCALWPGQDASTCRGDHRGPVDDDIKVRVDFRVKIPAKVINVRAQTMNGPIVAKGVQGDASLHTMNGLVDVDATGEIVAETANGEVIARAASGKPVKARTTNGQITLSLPGSAGADVDASTMNGRITSDFGEVPAPSMPALHSAKFKIGAGGAAVALHTTNGSIHVRRL